MRERLQLADQTVGIKLCSLLKFCLCLSAGMRILVNLLLDTLPMLGNVLLLCFFVFFIFGIIGVQLWAGLLRNRCYPEENFTLWVVCVSACENQRETMWCSGILCVSVCMSECFMLTPRQLCLTLKLLQCVWWSSALPLGKYADRLYKTDIAAKRGAFTGSTCLSSSLSSSFSVNINHIINRIYWDHRWKQDEGSLMLPVS